MADSNAAIAALVADIDAARDHVHLLFYIWLPDGNGTAVAQALCRAARRGVACRAHGGRPRLPPAADAARTGRRWRRPACGWRRALPVGNPLLRACWTGGIDLRNHRKIVVIDNRITYCGSQNCADPEFRIKAKYAPWVDAVLRFEGPVARQNQHLFASDWMTYGGGGHRRPAAASPGAGAAAPGFAAQVVGQRPDRAPFRHAGDVPVADVRRAAGAGDHHALLRAGRSHAGRALRRGNRGVATTIVFPARNDNWAVAAASRSYYADLLAAGVRIHEFQGGLLHAKTLTLDGEVALIGSANMDRRSFDLNYENNLLLADAARDRGDARAPGRLHRPQSRAGHGRRRSPPGRWQRRLWNNAVAVMGPVL